MNCTAILLAMSLWIRFATGAQSGFENVRQLPIQWVDPQKSSLMIGDTIKALIRDLPLASDVPVETPIELQPLPDPSPDRSTEKPSLLAKGWVVVGTPILKHNELEITLAPALPGPQGLPPLRVIGPDQTLLGITPGLPIQVLPPPQPLSGKDANPDAEKKPSILPPVGFPFPPWIILSLGVTGCILFATLAVAIFLWYLRWRRNRPKPVLPPKTPLEIAMNVLNQLEIEAPWQKGQFKRLYFGLSDILKIYLGARLKIDAAESTTFELIAMLRKQPLRPATLETLEKLFEGLDLVKFTDHIPGCSEAQDMHVRSRVLVQQLENETRPTSIIPGRDR